MLKAIFWDYTGTITKEGRAHMEELVMRMCKNSELHDSRRVVELWWK